MSDEEKKSEEQIIDDILKEQIQEGKEVIEKEEEKEYMSQVEKRRHKLDQYQKQTEAQKAAESLKKRKSNLKAAVNRFQKRKNNARFKALKDSNLETFDSSHAREITNTVVAAIGKEIKITPEIEKMLFPYYIAGASVRSIYQQFGTKFGFSMVTLYNAKDFYLWEQRRAAIRKKVMNDADSAIALRMKDYMTFLDDLLSEAIIRFKDNSDTNNNKNPFNTLKITSIKDIKDTIELMFTMLHGGTKKIDLNNTGNVNVNVKLDGDKRSKILAALADEDDNEEPIDAEFKNIGDNNESNNHNEE
jgi:hypothetical protein